MKYLSILLILLTALQLKSEELYSINTVHKLELNFYNSNYKQFLEQYREQEIDLPARLILNDTLVLDSVGVRYKGNSSFNIQSDKKSFNISIAAFREDQRLLGYKTLNLNNGFVDPTFMREHIVHRIYSKYLPALKTGYVYLYINGEEYGLYSNVQQINKDFLGEWYDYKSGNLYKGDPRGELSWKGSDPSLYKSDYEKKTNEQEDDWSDLVGLINAINNSANLEQDLPKVLNTDRVLWYFALSNIFVNLDSYIFSSHNYYLYNNPTTGLFDFLPWDLNESFGTFPPNLPFKKEEYPPLDLKAPNRTPLLKNMLAKDSYKQKYFAHYRTLFNEYFNQDSINSIIAEIKPVIDSFVQKDPKKLYSYSDFNKNITEDVIAGGRTVAGITSFVNKRRTYLFNQSEFKKKSPEIKNVKCLSDTIASGGDAVFNVEMKSTGTKQVMLDYRFGKGNFTSVEMFDDGQHNDVKSSDKTYGVSISTPENPRELNIDYYATAINYDDVLKFYPERAETEYFTKAINLLSTVPSIVINEFMASNKSTIADENGGYADWIEIHNRNLMDVTLDGWFITDDVNKKTKWKFPDIQIEALGYVLLWADDDEEQGELHTNFKLSRAGEYIGLYNADTNLIDFINFGEQTEDISFGRYPNGDGDFVLMDIPTPEAKNILEAILDTLPPVPVWTMDCCGNVNSNFEVNLWDMPQDSTRSNLSSIVRQLENYEMMISTFTTCIDSSASWRLLNPDCTKDASAILTFYDCAGNDTTIYIYYNAPNLSFSPANLDFGICQTGTVVDKRISLKNNSDKSEPEIINIAFTNNTSFFTSLDTNGNLISFPIIVNTLDSIPLIVRFSSNNEGIFTDSMIVIDTCLDVIAKTYITATTEGLGINENIMENEISIVPNPAYDNLVITSNQAITEIKIFDILGNEKKCSCIETAKGYFVNTSNLNDGIYLIHVNTSTNIYYKKFMICK